MFTINKTHTVIFLSAFLAVLFFLPTLTVLADDTVPPKIISISPTAVNRDDIVEVTGENFGGVYTGEVVINGSRITDIEDWSDTKIRVAVRGFTGTGDLPLFVRSNQGGVGNLVDSNTISLRVLQKSPKILSVTPNKVTPQGTTVEIVGENFGATQATYNGKLFDISYQGTHQILSWSDTRIRAIYNLESGNSYPPSSYLQIRVKCLDAVCNNYESGLGLTNKPTDEYWSEGDVLSRILIEAPICTSWTYSAWNTCSTNGQQTRSTSSASPNGCTGGSPILSQSCTPPAPVCTSFSYSSWSECSSDGKQIRNIISKYPYNCEGGESPKTTQSCTYAPPIPSCTADTWTCNAWSSCSLSGIQNRSCTKTFDCPNVQTAPPITDQYCEAPNRPTQQIPQNSSDEISNQDAIIKSTVKLLCPVDTQKASQGSGTIIDLNGTILTNKHVIAGTLGCLVGFINNFNDEPYFGDRHIADITRISPNQDIAILKIRNPQNKSLTSVDITKGSSNLRLGTKVTTYGFPAKFGTKVTYTSGDFSGTDGSYIKTTAILEYGNSGGGAYLKDGTFIGIPSAVVKGELNALGYILSINTINSWLGNSSTAYGGTSNNNYSRVSALEDIDIEKLGSLKLFIPDTDAKGDLSASAENQNSQNIKEQPQSNQAPKDSTIIEPTNTNQAVNTEQNNLALPEKGNNSSTKISEQRRSVVANAVQEIVKVAERSGGVGQEIKIVAQTQIQNQGELETGIQKIQSRSGFAKFFIGPNYGEIKNSQKLLEQNKEQIQELDKLRTQIVSQGDQLQIVEQIQLLAEANQQIEISLNEIQGGFSLFGWVFRLFAK